MAGHELWSLLRRRVAVTFSNERRCSSALCGADDEGAAGGFDDVVGDNCEVVDPQDAFDLDEEALDQTPRTACLARRPCTRRWARLPAAKVRSLPGVRPRQTDTG